MTYVPATSIQVCDAAISTQGSDGRAIVVELLASSVSTRTSTSVIVTAAWHSCGRVG